MPFFVRPGFNLGGSAGTDASFLLQNGGEAQPGFYHFSKFNGYEPGAGSPPPPPPAEGEGPEVPGGLYNKWKDNAGWVIGARMNDPADFIGITTGKTYDGLPRHAINVAEQCTEFYGFIDTTGGQPGGEKAIPASAQIQFDHPDIGPNDCTYYTTVYHFFYPGPYITGGKAFQAFTADGNRITFEHQHPFVYEPDGITLNNICTQYRVYKVDYLGGVGINRKSGIGTAIPGISPTSNNNVQPGLNHYPEFSGTYAYRRSWDYVYDRDHIYAPGFTPGGVGAFLIKLGKWYRHITTRDYSSGDGTPAAPYRVWTWLESDTDPRTLIMADDVANGFRGFPVSYETVQQESSDGVLFEWNNSSTYNAADFTARARDFFVITDVWGGDL